MTAAPSPGDRRALAAGVVVAALALSPPVEGRVGESLAAHMTQHVVLVGLVAPLLALGSPSATRRRGAGVLAAGALAQTAFVLGWHAPPLFDAAEDVAVVHAAEHLCLTGGAWLLWWAAARAGGPPGWGPGALTVFLALLPLTVLGVGMTFARTPWYDAHRDVSDQQLGGVVMWAGGGLLALAGALALGVAWVAHGASEGPSEGASDAAHRPPVPDAPAVRPRGRPAAPRRR